MRHFHLKLTSIIIGLLFATQIVAQQDTVRLLQITDTHLMFNLDLYEKNVVDHREITRGYKNVHEHFKQFILSTPKETNSDLIVITGDIIDFHDAKSIIGTTLPYQIEGFASLINNFQPCPLLFTLGNHDIFSYNWGNNKVIPNQDSSVKARATWIRNIQCFSEGTYYSKVVQAGKTTYRLIFLDDSYNQYEDNKLNPHLGYEQAKWLQNELNTSIDDVEIIFMHIPLLDQIEGNQLIEIIKKFPSCKMIISGHRHRNKITPIELSKKHILYQIETDALAKSPSNWRLIQLIENKVSISKTGDKKNELEIEILEH